MKLTAYGILSNFAAYHFMIEDMQFLMKQKLNHYCLLGLTHHIISNR